MSVPAVSVVMSVFNGQYSLGPSIDSVLEQQGVDLELIVVDDGSTDESGTMLDACAARDPRVRVIHQRNAGLTKALISGCEAAQSRYIARQDAGDIFLPGKLQRQIDLLESEPGAALVSCGTRFVGPAGEHLYDVIPRHLDATANLLSPDESCFTGPAGHGSVVFRHDLYRCVGGYREQFYFAQDLDLWARLAERGRHLAVPEVLFQVSVSPQSISGLQRRRQIELRQVILECSRLRRAGLSEAEVLDRAHRIVPGGVKPSALDLANAMYFIGSCLRKRNDPRAHNYFRMAWRQYPFHWKSLARLVLG